MSGQKHKISIGYTTRLFSDGLEAIIERFENFSVVFTSPIGKELSNKLTNNLFEQILILQVNCPSMRDLDQIKKLIESYPLLKILLLSLLPRTNIGFVLIESGISGYLLQSCAKEDLLLALNKISENKPYICSDITQNLFKGKKKDHDKKDYDLTDREKEVLSMLVSSHTNKQIAFKLNLSENTVKTHRRNIHTKFGVSNLLGMVRYACRSNLIDFGDDGYCLVCPYVN
ncbi:MAG: response regulator transcription factor [Deltaproteobacteria bacterium]|nr:response regulator transcription factor [Deltaproteobacteria bacterium]